MLVDDYTLTKLIEKGTFGEIYLASKKREKTSYAVKVINKSKYNKSINALKYLNNEINILKDLNHSNLLRCFEIKETSEKVFIITEYYNGGTLDNFLETYKSKYNKAPSEEIVQYIMRQIVEGIKYLHNKKIIYRDLNLTNIMINYEVENDRINNNIMKGKIKIAKFTYARYLAKGDLAKEIILNGEYSDPIIYIYEKNKEKFENFGYNEKVDIWYLGIVFYKLLIGKNPFSFSSLKLNEFYENLIKGDYQVPTSISKEAVSFLNCTLKYDPTKRLSIDILYNHEFLRKNVNTFTKISENINKSEIKINIKDNDCFEILNI